MKASRAALLSLIAYTLSTLPSFSQMPQDYWYQDGSVFGSGGTDDGQFSSPMGIAVGTNGLVYVVDYGNHRIQVIQSDGTFARKWGSNGSGDGQFYYPYGIAVGTNGLVYVADSNNHRVQVFQSDGTFVGKWGSGGSGDGQFNNPLGIAVGPNGLVYVADSQNHRVQVFQSNGTFVRKWGSGGGGDGQFNHPRGIAVGPNGFVFVADTFNYRIEVFQPDGTFVRKWGMGSNPWGIAVGSDGLVYTVYPDYNSVQVFQPDGTFARSLAVGSAPYYNAVGTDGRLYVTEAGLNRFQILCRGYRLPTDGMPLPGVTTVSQRVGVAYVDIDYTVLDFDSSNVHVAALGFVNGVSSMDNLVRLDTFLEGTSNNVGTNMAANVSHRLTWDAGADWNVSSGNMKFEILANDGRPMVDFHFITIPSNGPDPDLEIERFPMREADFQTCWYWLIATRDAAIDFRTNKVYGVSGSYADKVLAQSTTTTADGRAFLFERIHVREATSAEVNRARAGTTGAINQWPPRYPTDRRTKRNEFGFDSAYTQGADVWYVVPLP